MPINQVNYQAALHDFDRVHLKASLQEIFRRLTGKSNELLDYDEIAQKLKLRARADRGIQNIPVKAIIGSVGRYTDFTRNFLPRRESDRDRWARVKATLEDPSSVGLPPIDVYQVGEAYFVLDGNHRVSIARMEGTKTIEAHVIQVASNVKITPDLQPDDLIIKAEYAEFLEATGINNLLPNIDFSVTVPGQYQKLFEHIEVHRYFMGLDFQRDISYAEAVEHWYNEVYLPFIEPIRERGILRWFPNRTETDLYLWVSEHRSVLEEELEWDIRPDTAVESLATKSNPQAGSENVETGSWRSTRLFNRYTDHLFSDILVPVNDSLEWPALEQAIMIARKEKANLLGLHITSRDAGVDTEKIQTQFHQRCAEMSVHGRLVIKTGDISDQVCEHALLTDLVVLQVSHPPESGLFGLNSGLRSIIHRSARPILTVQEQPSLLRRALVAFDGSEKSKEALFVATYLSERWQTELLVLTVQDSPRISNETQEYTRAYLELHEIQAEYIYTEGGKNDFLQIILEKGIDLIVMGSYSGSVIQEIMIGSTVNYLLRETQCPILICR